MSAFDDLPQFTARDCGRWPIAVVTGSRDHGHPMKVWRALDAQLRAGGRLRVLHGRAVRGADMHAATWAHRQDPADVREWAFPAKWGVYGKAAGPIRTTEMLHEAALLLRDGVTAQVLVFWWPNAACAGTAHAFQSAINLGLPVAEFGDRPSWVVEQTPLWQPEDSLDIAGHG